MTWQERTTTAPRRFNAKYEKFAQLVAGGMKLVEAFTKAGLGTDNHVSNRTCASRLNRRMQARISEIIGCGLIPEQLKNTAITRGVAGVLSAFQDDVARCREELWKIIEDKDTPAGARVLAIKECLNRALGLPVQYTETNVNVRYEISDRELSESEWLAKFCPDEPIVIDGKTTH